MGKYVEIENDVFSVFKGESWLAENIRTFPDNFIPVNAGDEFIKVSIIPGSEGVNSRSIKGVVIIEIFTSAGRGPRRASVIADILNEYLETKTFSVSGTSSTQFLSSTMVPRGKDKDLPSLSRASYTIPFNYFGVTQ